ncbi:hypothetical protein Misp06_01205 [Microbulbifer sp. NBRC 101763]
MDCEIVVYLSEVGKVEFEIKGSFDLVQFNQHISKYVLD